MYTTINEIITITKDYAPFAMMMDAIIAILMIGFGIYFFHDKTKLTKYRKIGGRICVITATLALLGMGTTWIAVTYVFK